MQNLRFPPNKTLKSGFVNVRKARPFPDESNNASTWVAATLGETPCNKRRTRVSAAGRPAEQAGAPTHTAPPAPTPRPPPPPRPVTRGSMPPHSLLRSGRLRATPCAHASTASATLHPHTPLARTMPFREMRTPSPPSTIVRPLLWQTPCNACRRSGPRPLVQYQHRLERFGATSEPQRAFEVRPPHGCGDPRAWPCHRARCALRE